jgi:streptogramin lyase
LPDTFGRIPGKIGDLKSAEGLARALMIIATSLLLAGCTSSAALPAASSPSPKSSPVAAALPSPAACPAPVIAPGASPVSAPEPQLASSQVRATIPADSGPGRVVIGFGSVWVIAHRTNMIFRIDPATNKITASIHAVIPAQDSGLGGATVGATALWVPVTSPAGFQLFRVDPTTNQVSAMLPDPGGFGAEEIGGGVWVNQDQSTPAAPHGVVLRKAEIELDASTGKEITNVDLGPITAVTPLYEQETVHAFGSIWVPVRDQLIARVDPAAGKVLATIATPAIVGGYGTLVADGHHVFIAEKDSTVARVDPATNCIDAVLYMGQQLRRPRNPSAPTLGLSVGDSGQLYVTFDRGALALVDPTTMTIKKSVRVDEQDYVGGPAFGFGSIWFPTFGNDTVLRLAGL